jgi:hypothetical protein
MLQLLRKKENIMKAQLLWCIGSISGKNEDNVYYFNHKTRQPTIRKYTMPKHTEHTEHHDRMAAIGANLKSLNISEGYKQDLKLYCLKYNMSVKRKNCCSIRAYAMFIKMMWAMAKQLNLDLETITREQIENDNLPCRTVKQAVEAGLTGPLGIIYTSLFHFEVSIS